MIDDNGKKVSAIFKDKKNADKFNRNNPSDIKKLLDLAKKTKYPTAIDELVVNESVNEASIAFVNDKLVGDRIQKSGLLPLLGDNNASLNSNKMKFTKELQDTLLKLYKKYSSLTVK